MRPTLRTLALTGIVAAAAAIAGTARAQAQVGFAVQVGPSGYYYSNYVPPCPGVGYYWTPGYYAGAAWVPGRWIYREHYDYDHDRYYRHDYDGHDYDHRDYDRHDRDFDHRGWDHGRR